MFKKIFGVATILLFPLYTYAQINFSGQVFDKKTGEALSFSNVLEIGTYNGTTSNVEGFFKLFNVESDTALIRISYIGYENKFLRLDTVQINSVVNIYLSSANQELEDVVITAKSYQFIEASSGISRITISPQQLDLLPSIGEPDIFRSLQLLPGVSGTNENSSGLYIRGGTPDQNLVLLDGMTVYKVDHFFGFFSAFNSKAIKDVQIYKGTFPAKYGGRTSSVVELTGKSGSTTSIKGGLNINLLSTGAYLEVPISPKISLIGSYRRSYTDILQSGVFESISDNLIGESELPNPNTNINVNEVEPEFYFYDSNLRLSYRPTSKDVFVTSFYSGQDYLDESRNSNLTFSPPQNNPVQGQRLLNSDVTEETDWGNIAGSVKWFRQWNPNVFSNFTLAASEYFSNYERDTFFSVTIPEQDSSLFNIEQSNLEDNKVQDYTGRFDIEWAVNKNHSLSSGFQLTHSIVDYSNTRNDSITLISRNDEALLAAFYVDDEWKLSNRFTINPGMRFTYYEFSDQILLSPRFSAFYQLTKYLQLKGAYGRHYQFVNRVINENVTEGSRDFWLLTDNELTNTGLSDNFVAGFSLENDIWLLNIESYYKIFDNLSEFSLRFRRGPGAETDELFFNGNGEASGIEFLLQKKKGNYNGWVSYTLSSIANEFDIFNDGEPFPALHDQRHEFKLVQSYSVKNWNFSASFIYGSGKPFSEPEGIYTVELLDGRELSYIGVGEKNGSRLPEYHRLDVSAHYKFNIGRVSTDIALSLFNLYNRENTWYFEYDFTQEPFQITEINYLGFTPNFSLSFDF